jgi:hypothetical protein
MQLITTSHLLAKEIGFTDDKFEGWLYLDGKYIYISFIISKSPNKHNFSKLLDKITSKGYGIKVPTPFTLMRKICQEKGFKQTVEYDEIMGPVEVWVIGQKEIKTQV